MTIYSLVQWLPLSWWWAQHQSKKKSSSFYFAILHGASVRPYRPILSTVYLPSPMVSHPFLWTINWYTCFPLFSSFVRRVLPTHRGLLPPFLALWRFALCPRTGLALPWHFVVPLLYLRFSWRLAGLRVGYVCAGTAFCFTKPRTTEWNLSAGGFTCFTLLFRSIMDRNCCGFSTSMLGEFASHRFN